MDEISNFSKVRDNVVARTSLVKYVLALYLYNYFPFKVLVLVGVCLKIMMMEYLLTAVVLKPGGSHTVHICTQTVHRTPRNNRTQ